METWLRNSGHYRRAFAARWGAGPGGGGRRRRSNGWLSFLAGLDEEESETCFEDFGVAFLRCREAPYCGRRVWANHTDLRMTCA